jgi:xylulose-5-phosphate/fructose-6-phosphate phosphoketolase
MHMRGFLERGTTTTPFDMVMLNDLYRFDLVIDVIDRVPGLAGAHGEHLAYAHFRDRYRDMATTLNFEGHIDGVEAMP